MQEQSEQFQLKGSLKSFTLSLFFASTSNALNQISPFTYFSLQNKTLKQQFYNAISKVTFLCK